MQRTKQNRNTHILLFNGRKARIRHQGKESASQELAGVLRRLRCKLPQLKDELGMADAAEVADANGDAALSAARGSGAGGVAGAGGAAGSSGSAGSAAPPVCGGGGGSVGTGNAAGNPGAGIDGAAAGGTRRASGGSDNGGTGAVGTAEALSAVCNGIPHAGETSGSPQRTSEGDGDCALDAPGGALLGLFDGGGGSNGAGDPGAHSDDVHNHQEQQGATEGTCPSQDDRAHDVQDSEGTSMPCTAVSGMLVPSVSCALSAPSSCAVTVPTVAAYSCVKYDSCFT